MTSTPRIIRRTAEEATAASASAHESRTDLLGLKPRKIWEQLKKEHVSFWMACGYLFFEYVRPQTIYPAIDVLPWAMLLVVSGFVLSFADKTPRTAGSSLTIFIVVYGVVVALSSIAAYDPALSFEHLGEYFNWLIIYFLIVRTVRTKPRFFIFFTLYMLCNFKMSQHGFIAWASRGFAFTNYGIGGSPGWFQNSGEFGIQLCIFTPLIVAYVLAIRSYCRPLVRFVLYLIPITAVGSLLATNSRGALIGLAASALWSLKASRYFVRTVVVIGIVGALIYQFIPAETLGRFESSGSDRTSLVRLDRWEKGWATMKDHPLLGVGHKNWEAYYEQNLNYGLPGTVLVHNIFIESGTEHGFLGLGTLALLLATMFVVNARTRSLARSHEDTFSVFVAHGLDAATIGMIVSSCFVTVLYYPYVWIQAAFVAALSISVRATAHRLASPSASAPKLRTSQPRPASIQTNRATPVRLDAID